MTRSSFLESTGTELHDRFGSIGDSMLTLIAIMLNESAIAVIKPIGEHAPWCYAILFTFQVMVTG